MSKHLTPSAVVERIIGRPEVVGPAIGKTNKVGYLWRRASKGRDAGDIPSARDMRALLAYARDRGLPLMAQDLIYGADEVDVSARLAQMDSPACFASAGLACGVGIGPAPAAMTGGGSDAPALFGGAGDGIPAGGWGGAAGMVASAPAGAGSGGPAPAFISSRVVA